jgi:hypothetical protein
MCVGPPGRRSAAADDFFGSFCIKAKRTEECFKTKKRKEVSVVTFLFYALSFACAKESAKEKHTRQRYTAVAGTL